MKGKSTTNRSVLEMLTEELNQMGIQVNAPIEMMRDPSYEELARMINTLSFLVEGLMIDLNLSEEAKNRTRHQIKYHELLARLRRQGY